MVKIRLQRLGRRNRSCYRIVVTDARTKRDGVYLEKVGQYDPVEKSAEKQLVVNTERVQHWLGRGAQLTESVALLLRKRGMALPAKKRRKPKAARTAPAKA